MDAIDPRAFQHFVRLCRNPEEINVVVRAFGVAMKMYAGSGADESLLPFSKPQILGALVAGMFLAQDSGSAKKCCVGLLGLVDFQPGFPTSREERDVIGAATRASAAGNMAEVLRIMEEEQRRSNVSLAETVKVQQLISAITS